MKKAFALSIAFFAVNWLAGCASLKGIDFPDSSSNKGKKVTASVAHFNILLLVPPSNVDKLVDDLSEQCGNGKVEGISITDTRRWLLIGEMVSLYAAGHCAE